MKVICTSPSFAKHSNKPIIRLQQEGIELVRVPPDISQAEFVQEAKGAEAAIVAFNKISDAVLAQLPDLKVVAKHGVGVDNIDVAAAKKHGVIVTNVPNANKHAVADFAFSLLLSLARQIPSGTDITKKGEWPSLFGADVYQQTLGIIGLGAIGKEVARRASGFAMNVLAYDPYIDRTYADQNGIEAVSLEALLQQSDFVTVHIPLLPATRHLIGERELQLMKKSAYLVNASRGGIVDETALYEALQTQQLAGAALDVFEKEPLYKSPLFSLDSFIAMPHVAGYTPGAINTLSHTCVDQIIAVLKGKGDLIHVVSGP
ncbi:phosphoglycerate dehydrogenase [Shouchella tritolerans]|uniref:phosphoglycerate dehydrogenase n=1 Tax=Shouchella tritolerans TaxID=2979466 RepID=UPI0021E7557B|nr:phosphoglycerate dehydrogenase [Shouchella tritolerans]